MNLFKYWIQLVYLDDAEARFHNDQNKVTLSIPVDQWIKIGRPGAIAIEPTPAAP